MVKILSGRNITYTLDDDECLSSDEKLSGVIKEGFIIAAIGFVMMSLLVLYAMRSPSGKKKVARVIETYSRSIPSSSSKKAEATQKANNYSADVSKSKASLILDGYGDDNRRYRIVINVDELYKGEVIVGRDPSNRKYAIDDDSISRQHCVFYAQGNDLFIRDMESTNGTYVNGRQLTAKESVALNNGANVKLGSVSFKVIAG